ncbi:FmdB family zinc ribbon protein [Desulforudis sp. 1088]|uniref:FmdB family zinc ribbon protein n=1 Tax=unclassified Candidatus Desulforudis TaxID=2635950 RepID=UPI0034945580
MPIYEFRCAACGRLFEKLFRDAGEKVEIKCPDCGSEEADRVISRANAVMGSGKGKKAKLTTKSCSPGSSCHTLEIPGAGD